MSNISDLSILIKTFIRPQCLENILFSIKEYQDYHNVVFPSVVIIDDSDSENIKLNKEIISKYQSEININYKEYEFNSLVLSKGRNEGIKEIKTKYFLLCDDDFMLDKNCPLENNILLLEQKNIDILGGIYSDIHDKNQEIGYNHNWLGFIEENETVDFCTIYEFEFPDFCRCDIVENFYIARRDVFDKVQYPEDMPMLEHNVFFLRAKQQGIKVGFTNNLWVRHLHLNNENKSYEGFRRREVVNPIKKQVIGTLHSYDRIVKFYDYLYVCSDNYYVKPEKIKKISMKLGPIRLKVEYQDLYNKIQKIKNKIKNRPIRKKLKQVRKEYPNVLSTSQTLDKIINEKKSIARFGDGELQLIMGKSLGNKGENNEYQVYDEKLSNRLREILKNPNNNCIVAIDKFSDRYNDEKNYKNGLSYFENFWLNFWDNLKNLYNKDYYYGCTASTRLTVFKENNLSRIKQIWDNKKVLFVVGNDSHFVDEQRLFNNVQEKRMLVTKGKSSFSEYDSILAEIKKFSNDWLIILCLGPTATVLAYDLSNMGYQAIDAGHLPNCYLQYIGERQKPEAEHFNDNHYKKEIGLH